MELIVGVRGIHGLLILTHYMSLVLISTNYAAEKKINKKHLISSGYTVNLEGENFGKKQAK